jgi:hypothetical protein
VVPESYCRDIEAYLCRKNDGHLIRIAGPAFERVSRWADAGIPLTVVCVGIDRYFERYYRRGPRRRPVRVEFCEADVLDAFDDWRRAVGVTLPGEAGESAEAGRRPRSSLASHIERAIATLTALCSSSQRARAMSAHLELLVRELDQMPGPAKTARGAMREELVTTLAALDRRLVEAALVTVDEDVRRQAEEEATTQLAPFRQRMTAEDYERALDAAIERHIREYFALPTLAFP